MSNPISIIDTYKKAFKLYFQSFMNILPYLSLATIANYLCIQFAGPSENFSDFMKNDFPVIMINSVFSLTVMYVIYKKHHGQKINFLDVIENIGKRLPALIAVYGIILLPFAMFGLMWLGIDYAHKLHNPGNSGNDLAAVAQSITSSMEIIGSLLIVAGILSLVYTFFALRFSYFAGLLLVSKKLGPISSLKASWKLTKGKWWKLFFIFVIFCLFSFACTKLMGFVIMAKGAEAVNSILMMPLWSSVIVILLDRIETTTSP
ncbi:MAG: hypothetical protein JSR17_02320 [Proteobacteria bacterium]|nr:hypothetical protein [Pseudomonadota bacterium]